MLASPLEINTYDQENNNTSVSDTGRICVRVLYVKDRVNIKRNGDATNEYAIIVGMTAINLIFNPIGNAEASFRSNVIQTWTYRQYIPVPGSE